MWFWKSYVRFNAFLCLFIRREGKLYTGLMSNNSDKIKLPERELKVMLARMMMKAIKRIKISENNTKIQKVL